MRDKRGRNCRSLFNSSVPTIFLPVCLCLAIFSYISQTLLLYTSSPATYYIFYHLLPTSIFLSLPHLSSSLLTSHVLFSPYLTCPTLSSPHLSSSLVTSPVLLSPFRSTPLLPLSTSPYLYPPLYFYLYDNIIPTKCRYYFPAN